MQEHTGCLDFSRWRGTRRNLLRIGSLGAVGLALPCALRAEQERTSLRVRARSVIFLHQFGGASHHDTFDMKPNAPAGIRGEFKPIPSNVSGIDVCELLPRMAKVAHLYTLVRSVHHTTSNHNSATY